MLLAVVCKYNSNFPRISESALNSGTRLDDCQDQSSVRCLRLYYTVPISSMLNRVVCRSRGGQGSSSGIRWSLANQVLNNLGRPYPTSTTSRSPDTPLAPHPARCTVTCPLTPYLCTFRQPRRSEPARRLQAVPRLLPARLGQRNYSALSKASAVVMADRDVLPDTFKPVHYELLISHLNFAEWTYKGKVV